MTIDTAFNRFPSLTTNRLILRYIQLADAEDLFATFSDEEAMKFYGNEPIRSVDETREWIEYIKARYGRNEIIGWGITRKAKTARSGRVVSITSTQIFIAPKQAMHSIELSG